MKTITVTQPSMPPLSEFVEYLEKIWESKWLTNNGQMHQDLEQALADYLGVKYISLFSNGTLALITGLQALRITGEVITTPYSFVATTHSLWWNGIKPVFVDIDPVSFNLDPKKIEAAISPKTTAIMPVHVYGNPCELEKIQYIADTYGLKVIYDAAHAFGVKRYGTSVLNAGDMSILSFHATKVFSTIEGGAIVCHDESMKRRIDYLKNFGFAGETKVVAPGINAKLNEVQAAFGLLQLKYIDGYLARRREIARLYRRGLEGIPGLSFSSETEGVEANDSYFAILIDSTFYGMERDAIYERLKELGIHGRRYFYPLISDFSTYSGLPSASADNLPVATEVAKKVICLPIFPDLSNEDLERICVALREMRA